jgi:hypothetical protein
MNFRISPRDCCRQRLLATKPQGRPCDIIKSPRIGFSSICLRGAISLHAALATVRSAELRVREFDIGHNGAERIDEMRCLVQRKRLPEDYSVPAGLMELT